MLGGSPAALDNFICTEVVCNIADEGGEPQIVPRNHLDPRTSEDRQCITRVRNLWVMMGQLQDQSIVRTIKHISKATQELPSLRRRNVIEQPPAGLFPGCSDCVAWDRTDILGE